MNWLQPERSQKIRECVKFLLSDAFLKGGDGFKRGLFVLSNELKRLPGDDDLLSVLRDWNVRMGSPLRDQDLQYQVTVQEYHLSCQYIHEFLESLGHSMKDICARKL